VDTAIIFLTPNDNAKPRADFGASVLSGLLEPKAKWIAATIGLANVGCNGTDCGHRVEIRGELAEEMPLNFELILAPCVRATTIYCADNLASECHECN